MFENICTLPLTSNLTTLTLHPTLPLLAVGLASGHLQTLRLPAVSHSNDGDQHPRPLEPRASFVGGKPARRSSDGGVGTVETAWRTRRHKGSCRALAYGLDGESLYSAGVDGLLKVASAETGRVFAKALVGEGGPQSAEPMVMEILSPQALLLATDAGEVHVYDVRAGGGTGLRPQKTLRPHEKEDGAVAIERLSVLGPSEASTSGTARQWVTVAGGTVAACDLRKGALGCSRDQGDVLSGLAVVKTATEGTKRRKLDGSRAAAGKGEVVVTGGSNGLLLFDRGQWEDHRSKIKLAGEDVAVDCIAAVPDGVLEGAGMVAVGTEEGRVFFESISSKRKGEGQWVSHDETGVEGVTAIGFDVTGRMITGGGEVVKIWFDNGLRPGETWWSDGGEDEEDHEGNNGMEVDGSSEDEDDDNDISSSEDDRPAKGRKQKRGGAKTSMKGGHGHHGILAFQGMT